jgi:Zn-dependent protease with chaperone function
MSVRLTPGHGYVVTRIPTVARTNPMRRQITLDRKVFFALAPEERLALVAHELAHLRQHHSLYSVLMASGGSVVALLLLPSPYPVLSAPAWAIGISGMLIFRRLSEYQADQLAAKFADPQRLASALMKLSKERRSRVANLTHPSPSRRAAKLTRGTR